MKFARRRIAGARERHGARVFKHERSGSPFSHNWAHNLPAFTRLQIALSIPIECDDDMIGHRQLQAGFRLSAEDLPLRLSATIS
jgi:hypothetical protein